jgi:epidermal growth factor receptor substrate 15
MESSKLTSTHDFLESIAGDIPHLEAKLSSRLRELCERNNELSRRNAELHGSAEIGWNAELQIKKLSAIEGSLREQIRDLQMEVEIYADAINDEAEKSASLKGTVTKLEQKIAQIEEERRLDHQHLNSLKEQAKKSEDLFQIEKESLTKVHQNIIATIERRHEQSLALAQESFHSQLSDLGKVAWNSGHEALELTSALTAAKNDCARLEAIINEQEAKFRTQLAELAQSGWESESELSETKKTSEQREATFAAERAHLTKTATELRRALESERQAHAQVKVREIEARAELDRIHAQAKNDAGQAAQILKVAVDAKNFAEASFEAQKSAVSDMSNELNVKIREWRESQEIIQKQMCIIGEQSRSLQERSVEISTLRAENRSQTESLRSQLAEIEGLSTALKVQREINERQLVTLANMSRAEKEKDLEVQRFHFVESSLNESIQELRRAGQERDELRSQLEGHIARLNDQLKEARDAVQRSQEGIAQEVTTLNSQLQSARAQIESSRSIVEELRSEREFIREQLKAERNNNTSLGLANDQKVKGERAELERLSAQLQQREFQLRTYAASVSEEKSEVLRRARLLADEIRAATTLAPLKDYLALTEFELGKVEILLRKTPVISIERPRLEANFNQMIEQRDFLKTAIANSQRQLDHQAMQLMKIARPEKLSPIPPMPPRTTEA